MRMDLSQDGLATFGDSLVNFIYSLALTRYLGRPSGGRVSNASLAMALELAGLRHLAPRRTDKHGLGDAAEAIVAYAFLSGVIGIEEASEIVERNLSDDVTHFSRRKEVLGRAFGELLKEIRNRLDL